MLVTKRWINPSFGSFLLRAALGVCSNLYCAATHPMGPKNGQSLMQTAAYCDFSISDVLLHFST